MNIKEINWRDVMEGVFFDLVDAKWGMSASKWNDQNNDWTDYGGAFINEKTEEKIWSWWHKQLKELKKHKTVYKNPNYYKVFKYCSDEDVKALFDNE